jgi:glycosyltransferase 2 family protein
VVSTRTSEELTSSSAAPECWTRHPADVARMVVAAGVWLLATSLVLGRPADARGFSTRLLLLFDGLPDSVTVLLVGLLQVGALLAPLAAVALVRHGRWRELTLAAGAAALTALVGSVLAGRLAGGVPDAVLIEADRSSWLAGSAFPSGTYLAAAAAVASVLAPSLPRPWRRTLWWAVGVVALGRVVTAVEAPVGLVSSVAAGVFIGSLVMVVFGAPTRRPAAAEVQRALEAAGLVVRHVAATVDHHRHGPTYVARGPGGDDYFVKLVGRDERDAELLSRAVRAIRASSPHGRPSVSPAETVEHEALGLLLAGQAGVAVPGVVTLADVGDRYVALVLQRLRGRTLDEAPDAGDASLRSAFDQLARLHATRASHGWASLSHVVVGADGAASLTDFRWSTISATDPQRARDLAELLCATAAGFGADRAVAAARSAFPPDRLAEALPFVQPLAVSAETRAAIAPGADLLADVRESLRRAAGVEHYEMVKLERVTWRKVMLFAASLVLVHVLLSVLGNAGEIWDAMRQVDLAYLPMLIVIPTVAYPAGAVSLMGAVHVRLAFWPTTELMFAQSFLNRFTPANAGGMALRTKYLQENGVPLVNAASSVAITSAASGVVQVAMGAAFFAWAGRSDDAVAFRLPSGQLVALVVVVLLALVGAAWASAAGRKLLQRLRVTVGSLRRDLTELGRRPSKLFLLFGGAFVAKVVAIVALAQTMRAFGMTVDFPVLGAMYITATTIASASPTPGGVGAIEAALTAGLTGLGEEAGQAAAVVLVFRIFTYWLPVLPCWYFLTRMQRTVEA